MRSLYLWYISKMIFPLPWVVLFASLLNLCATSPAFDRLACQYPTADPLEGCPANTILVGSSADPNVQFTSIQPAVLSLPNDNSSQIILILAGDYTEQVNVTRSGPLTLLGQTPSPTDQKLNTVSVYWAAVAGTGHNAATSTLTVAPAGAPFGNSDFRAYNIDFVNDYAPYADTPSQALGVSYANAGFYYCGFYSYQDTIYVGELGNTYMFANEIAGEVDFLYGYGTLWVQSSLLSLRSCGGGITAWKGTNTTFENMYGVYIHDSAVKKANSTLQIEGECALGRPWNAQTRSLFAYTYLDSSIRPAGYIEWQPTDPRIDFNTTMTEYENYGPGFNLTGRLDADLTATPILTEEEYTTMYATFAQVFQYPFSGAFGNVAWIDKTPWS